MNGNGKKVVVRVRPLRGVPKAFGPYKEVLVDEAILGKRGSHLLSTSLSLGLLTQVLQLISKVRR